LVNAGWLLDGCAMADRRRPFDNADLVFVATVLLVVVLVLLLVALMADRESSGGRMLSLKSHSLPLPFGERRKLGGKPVP
jgi:hypothetical protein